MDIKKTSMPPASILNSGTGRYDYVDSFSGVFADPQNQVTVDQVGKAFFSSGPTWIGGLFALRNKIVALFGLKVPEKIANHQEQLNNFKCLPGERLGLFQVFDATDNEVVLGEDDRHLNFRVSFFLARVPLDPTLKELTITTTVTFHNWFGRLYFLPVRPFHSLIVPAMLKGMIKSLEKTKTL